MPLATGARAMIEGRLITTTVSRCSMIGLTEQVQRLRADEFGKELFTIPAFEMLLDLYTRRSVQPRSLTSLTGASSASERNSQRIVHRLAERGFVDLHRDPSDGRRIIVEIGRASCRERVCQYVSISVVAVSLKKKTNNK